MNLSELDELAAKELDKMEGHTRSVDAIRLYFSDSDVRADYSRLTRHKAGGNPPVRLILPTIKSML